MSDELERAVAEFAVESREGLDRLEADLLSVEADATAPLDVARLFRVVHTIKGTAGFFAFTRVERVAHAAEGLLALVRDGRARVEGPLVSALLRAVDVLRMLLRDVERTRREGDVDVRSILERLAQIAADLEATSNGRGGPVVQPLVADGPDTSVRVDIALLDTLMNLVGELVLVRNQALQLASDTAEAKLQGPVQRLNLVATELQQSVMKTRMQPIATAWSKLPRLVRDLALQCGKRARLETEGEATELDRTIMDTIRDPITHLVRNAVDHGLEAPDLRTAQGKAAEGRVLLRAYHEGGTVNIEISDDGAGIDYARVAARAVELGLLAAEQVARADHHELAQVLFRPGFTTARELTTVSGRGVGLDVVRSNIERIGGAVDLVSSAGVGTTVRLKIPLTLAIIPALVVTGGAGQRYLIPQANVVEVVRIGERAALEAVLGAPVYRLRGRLLTLVDLDRALGEAGVSAGAAHIVVLRADARTFGLVVENVLETEEIVVKPLPRHAHGAGAFAAATVMGDGRVALILDAVGLAQRAGPQGRGRASGAASRGDARAGGDGERLLIVEISGGERAAIPLDAVSRLEEVGRERIERIGGAEVVQYRGEILPLVEVSAELDGAAPRPSTTSVSVVVHAGPEGNAGLVVERIIDIVEERLPTGRPPPRPGVLCTAVIQQRVTRVLDVPSLVRGAHAGTPLA